MENRDLGNLKEHQAALIIDALEMWCNANPGNRVIMGRTAQGFKVALATSVPFTGHGLQEALAQAAQTAALEGT